jgi:Domain of Unknown Function (DUF1080)
MKTTLAAALLVAASVASLAADPLVPRPPQDMKMTPEDTEVWKPVPPIVRAPAGGVPSDAIVLFDGRSVDAWLSAKNDGPVPWKMDDGALVVAPGSGDIRTKASFGDIQLHLEFRSPAPAEGTSQGRGNSGVFFMGLYELQILDSYDNPTYVNGQAGAAYKQTAPLVNASRPPGEWQTYDAVWSAPRFAADGRLLRPARLTLFHNGVLVQNNTAYWGPTMNRGKAAYFPHPARLPLVLQEHHNPVAFRNIWIRELALPDGS